MQRIALLAIALFLVVAVGIGVWFLHESSTASGALVAPPAAPSSAQASGPTDEAKLELTSTPDAAAREATAAPAAGGEENWDVAKGTWAKGVVRLPAGVVDDGLEVWVLRRPQSYAEFAELRDERSTKIGGVLDKSLVRAHRPVEADGRFAVPIPPDTTHVHLMVQGKFGFLAETQVVEPAELAHEIVLTAQAGAWIHGTLDLPADAQNELESLNGLEITLAPNVKGFQGNVMRMQIPRRAAHVKGGAFEWRAVSAEVSYDVQAEPEHFAAVADALEGLSAGAASSLRIALLHGGTVRGLVKSSTGAPVPEAEVAALSTGRWFGFDDRKLRTTTSKADGSFELVNVTPGKLSVRAKAKTFLDSENVKLDLADGGLATGVTLELTGGGQVSGKVTWADGKPAEKVAVELEFDKSQMYGLNAFNAARGAEGHASTGADGQFTISGLGKGPFTLKARSLPPGVKIEDAAERAKAELRARIDGVAPGTKNIELVLREPAGVKGRVVDTQGAPVKKFDLIAKREGKGMLGGLGQDEDTQSFSDDDGHFVFGGLVEGSWKLWAKALNFALPDATSFTIPRAASEPQLVLTLQQAASVQGLVKDADGHGVPDAKIDVDTGQPSWQRIVSGGPELPNTKSGPDATFVIEGLKPGKISLVATAKGYAKSLPLALELQAGQVLGSATIVMRAGGTLTGEVYAESGEAAAGLMVQVTAPKNFEQQMSFSDGQGRFKVEHLEPGSYQVVAMSTAGLSGGGAKTEDSMGALISQMKMGTAEIVDGQETHIVLGAPPKDPVHVHGRITQDGAAYKGALVSFMLQAKMSLKKMKNTAVDAEGNYSVVLEEGGAYAISVQKIGKGVAQQNTVEFSKDVPQEKDVALDLSMPVGRISGRVRGPDGKPAIGARVTLHPESALMVGTMWGGQYVEGATDEEGRFDLQSLRPGNYNLLVGGMSMGGMFGDDASLGRAVKNDLHLAEGEWMQNVEFRLEKPGSVELNVVDETGAPVAEAAVFARTKDGKLLDKLSFLVTDGNGHVHYGGLAQGDYSFSARKGVATSVEGANVKLGAGEKTEAKLVLQSGTLLLITTEDSDGKPVAASLTVTDEAGREVSGMYALSEIMKLFSEGALDWKTQHVGPLAPGKYKVKATLADGRSATKSVTLSGQPERNLTLRIS